jgi:hypothetical protein
MTFSEWLATTVYDSLVELAINLPLDHAVLGCRMVDGYLAVALGKSSPEIADMPNSGDIETILWGFTEDNVPDWAPYFRFCINSLDSKTDVFYFDRGIREALIQADEHFSTLVPRRPGVPRYNFYFCKTTSAAKLRKRWESEWGETFEETPGFDIV